MASFMNSRHSTPGPIAEEMPYICELSELPIHTAVSSCGTYPTASTSRRLSVVPVLSAAVRPMLVQEPKIALVFGSVMSFSMSVISHDSCGEIACVPSGCDQSRTTLPSLSSMREISVGSIRTPPSATT